MAIDSFKHAVALDSTNAEAKEDLVHAERLKADQHSLQQQFGAEEQAAAAEKEGNVDAAEVRLRPQA
jgi:hypothetical protein